MSLWSQHLLPHGPWQKLADQLWLLQGTLPRGSMPRTMVVYRKSNGGLIVHSGVVIDDEALSEMLSWGRIDTLIVPNPWHRLDAAAYREKFPNIQIVAPRAAMAKVAEKVAVDGAAEDLLIGTGFEPWNIEGIKATELCYRVDLGKGHGLVFTDALMNLSHLKGLEGWILRLVGSTGFFGMTAIGRLILLKERKAFKQWLLTESQSPGLRLVAVAHGAPILGVECSLALRRAAERLGS
jgi:hypothetical protein